jgi:hypothetical protein
MTPVGDVIMAIESSSGDISFRHPLAFLTDEDVLISRTISVDVPKADMVIRLVPSMLKAYDLAPIRRDPNKIRPSLTMTNQMDHLDQLSVGDRENLQSAVLAE